ncbi:AMP-binding protein [bacterium]|nr:AMP-binding protein [bacterium]
MSDLASFQFFENPRGLQQRKRSAFEFLSEFDPALLDLLYFPSSGSTGEVKWLALSAKAMKVSASSVNSWIASQSNDVFLRSIPNFHVGGYSVGLRAQLISAPLVELKEAWSVETFVEQLRHDNITVCSLVPTQVYDLVLKNMSSPNDLRVVLVGGGALDEGLYKMARQLGWPLLPTFGMTEASSQVATASLESLNEQELPRMIVLPHWQVSCDEENFLCLNGESLASGILSPTEDGAWTYISINDEEPFKTQDKVKIVESLRGQSLEFLARDSDVFKIGGELCSLTKLVRCLDEVVLSMQLCQKFAVVDVFDQRLGRKVVLAFERGVDQHTVQRLEREFNKRVMPYEGIRSLCEVESLPRSDLGKIQRPRLRKLLESREII